MKRFFKACLLAGISAAVIGCSSPNNSSGGNENCSDPTDISLDGKTFKNTGSVQVMTSPVTITGCDDYNNKPLTGAFPAGRTVTLSPFIIGKYEVTQELYEAVMTGQKVKLAENTEPISLSKNPSYCTLTADSYKNMLPGEEQKYRPVEGVTWYDACYFCNVLSEKMGLEKAYIIMVTGTSPDGNIISAAVAQKEGANGYRLPTEAEWEYAARGGSKANAEQFKYYFSGADTKEYDASENKDLDKVGWYCYNIKSGETESSVLNPGDTGYGTHQVGKKSPNAAGLFDMSGNVWEWCYDWYEEFAIPEEVTNPSGPEQSQGVRIKRGGCWSLPSSHCAAFSRSSHAPSYHQNYCGFRVVRNVQ